MRHKIGPLCVRILVAAVYSSEREGLNLLVCLLTALLVCAFVGWFVWWWGGLRGNMKPVPLDGPAFF